MVDAAPVHLALLDRSGHVVMANRAWSEAAANGMPCRVPEGGDFLAECDRLGGAKREFAEIAKGVRQAFGDPAAATTIGYEWPVGGRERWYLCRVGRNDVDGIPLVAIAHDDVTELEARYRRLVETVPAVVYIWEIPDESTVAPYVYTSPQIEDLLGYPAEDWQLEEAERLWNERIHPEDLDRVLAAVRRTEELGEPFLQEYRFLAKDGRVVWVRDEARVFSIEPGGPRYFQGVMTDITAWKESEAALRETSERLEALVRASPLSVVIADPDGVVLSWNPAAERIFGWSAEEAIGRFLPFVPPDRMDEFRSIRDRVVAGTSIHQVEVERVRKDGSPVLLSLSVSPIHDAEGRVVALASIQADISDRKRAERELERSRAQLAEAQRIARIGSFEHDFVTGEAVWSDELYRLYGLDRRDTPPGFAAGLEVVHPDDREELAERTRHSFEEPGEYELRHRIVRPDGSTAIVHRVWRTERDSSGRVVRMVGTVQDVTEAYEAEQALREAEARYRLLVEQLPAVVYLDHPDELSSGIYMSPQCETLTGYSSEEWVADPRLWVKCLHPEDRDRVLEESRRSNVSGAPFRAEYRLIAKDGGVVWVRDEAVLLRDEAGLPAAWQGVMIDVTERKAAEEALHDAEARYRSLVERLPAVVYLDVVNPDDPVDATPAYISPRLETVLGYTPEEWVGDPYLWGKVVHPEDRDRVERLGDAARLAGQPFGAEYRMRTRDGRIVWVREESVLIRDAAGRPAYWQGIILDITEKKAAEEALGRQEEWFRKLTEHSSDIVFVVDRDHVVRYVSPSVTRVLGWSPVDALGTDVLRLAHREDREAARQALEVALSRPGVGPTIETRTRHRDGTWRWIEMIGTNLLDDPAVGGLVINARDVTERRSAEEILRQSESGLQQALAVLREADRERRKLVAHLLEAEAAERGRMAEGIEDRSLQDMAAVGMRLEALRRSLDDPDQLAAIDKLRGTVEQALARLKRVLVELHPRALEQDGLAAALGQYLRAAFPSGAPRVSVDSRLAREPALEVRSVAYRIAQEAIAGVARIGGAAHVMVRLEDRDAGVLVRVVDDGAGFRQEDLEDDRRLRLSSMEERARLAGGWLRVDSEPGRGTTVEFWVPGREEPGT